MCFFSTPLPIQFTRAHILIHQYLPIKTLSLSNRCWKFAWIGLLYWISGVPTYRQDGESGRPNCRNEWIAFEGELGSEGRDRGTRPSRVTRRGKRGEREGIGPCVDMFMADGESQRSAVRLGTTARHDWHVDADRACRMQSGHMQYVLRCNTNLTG